MRSASRSVTSGSFVHRDDVVAEPGPQRRQRVRGLALDRPFTDPESVGDLAHTEVGVVAEDNDGALPRRQGAQRLDHGGPVGELVTAAGWFGQLRRRALVAPRP